MTEPTWSREPPTEPGLYWFLDDCFPGQYVFNLERPEPGEAEPYELIAVFHGGTYGRLSEFDGLWGPRLDPPDPPKITRRSLRTCDGPHGGDSARLRYGRGAHHQRRDAQ